MLGLGGQGDRAVNFGSGTGIGVWLLCLGWRISWHILEFALGPNGAWQAVRGEPHFAENTALH